MVTLDKRNLDSKLSTLLFLPSIKVDSGPVAKMQSKDEIYQQLVSVIGKLFEVEAENITPASTLVEDLDIDSIDAVDMAIELNEITGKKIQPDEFKNISTVQDVVDIVYQLVND